MKVRSMRGVEIDMSALIARNEHVVAVGNANLNARGDVLGPGGRIIKARSEIAQEYHRNHPKSVSRMALKDLDGEITPQYGSDRVDVDFADPATAYREALDAAKEVTKRRKIADTDD